MPARIIVAVLGLLLFPAFGAAQAPSVIGVVHGSVSPEGLGSQNALAGLGDVNNDGVPDFVAGAPNWPAPHPTVPGATVAQVGKARIFSGATMLQLFDVTGTYNLQALGTSVANVGDCDGDGRNDVAVGAPMFGPIVPGGTPPPPQVQIWSGALGTLIRTITSGTGGFASAKFGSSIAGVGDLGQLGPGGYSSLPDGIPDVLIGASAGNAAAVYSGADGALLYAMDATTINPPLPAPPVLTASADFGGTVAACGDVTGDGTPDLLVCARLNAVGGASAGAVFVLSGAGGGVVHVFQGAAGDTLGQGAAGIGDVNGDLVPDIAIGATKTDGGATDTGSVTVYAGGSWAPLWATHGLVTLDSFGFAISDAGDVTGDGRKDVLVGTPTTDLGATNTGSATLLDGATGARLGSIDGLLASDLLGRAVASYGDADGDGTPDVLAAAPSADVGGTSTGTVSVISFGPYLRPCAAGTIPAGGGGTFDMIHINGSTGGFPRRVDIGAFQPFTVSFTQPPTFFNPAPLYSFLLIGVPLPADETTVPGIGLLCYPPPVLSPADPRLALLANSFFPPDFTALFPNPPLGSWNVPIPGGLPAPFRVAVTGITSDGSLYVTNTVLLNVQ
jgi:FG-GAP repeat